MAKTEKMENPVTETAYDPWKDMKEVFIPRGGKGEPKSLFVSYNGRDFQIPKGKRELVPAPIAKRVEIYLQATAALMDTMADIEAVDAPDRSAQFRQF